MNVGAECQRHANRLAQVQRPTPYTYIIEWSDVVWKYQNR